MGFKIATKKNKLPKLIWQIRKKDKLIKTKNTAPKF